jgi:guanine deaminase
MDREAPPNYCESSVSESISGTESTISYIRSLKTDLVYPIITPRFAISTTTRLLAALGELVSKDESLAIQTHISENPSEVAYVKRLFPNCKNYAHVYETFGLLRNNTILAHGCHLDSHLSRDADEMDVSESELNLIKRTGTGLSHCPTSNLNLRSGVAKVGDWLDRGIKVNTISSCRHTEVVIKNRSVLGLMSPEDIRHQCLLLSEMRASVQNL